MVLEQLHIHMEKMSLKPYFIQYKNINSKWITKVSIKAKTVIYMEYTQQSIFIIWNRQKIIGTIKEK
jgi:hypothetical protein